MSVDDPLSAVADPAVTVRRDGPVAVLTLSRSAKANAMDGEITGTLLHAVRSLCDDGDVRAMVLTGAGRSFSAGGDIETIRKMREDRAVREAIAHAPSASRISSRYSC